MITTDHAHGLSMILTAPEALRWNISYAAAASFRRDSATSCYTECRERSQCSLRPLSATSLQMLRLVWKDRNGYGCMGSCLHRATS